MSARIKAHNKGIVRSNPTRRTIIFFCVVLMMEL
jgi:hypothetical protein